MQFNKFRLLICYQLIIIVVVSVLIYLYTLGNNFAYDDKFTITNNYLIRSWHKIPAIFTNDYFTASGELSYRPVVTLSYFIDYFFWRLNPSGYHLTNLFLHSLNSVLLFLLISRLWSGIRDKPDRETWSFSPKNPDVCWPVIQTAQTAVPFIASLIFCTCPILAEAVNAISYREDIMAATFYFAAFLFYLKTSQRRSVVWYAISLVCYFLGLFSKEMAITFPILIGLYDILRHGKTFFTFKRIRYYIGYILITVFYVALRFVFLHNPTESYIPYPQNSLWINFLTMSKVIASYIKLLFFPVHLNADYVVPHASSPLELSFILSFLLIVSVIVVTYRLFFYSKTLFFSILWFFVTLLPVLNIIPIENIMAERYLYIPLVGFCILGGQLLSLIPKSGSKSGILTSCSFPLIIVIILIGFSWQTCNRSKIWFDELSLWSTTVVDSPQSSRAHNNLGVLFKKMGFVDAAMKEYNTAIQIRPDYSEAHGNLANVYMDKGLSILDKRVLSKTHDNLAKAYADEGHLKNAIAEYKKSIQISPFNETAHFNLGVTYGKMGLTNDAEIEYKNVIQLNDNNPHAHNNLGNIYEDRDLLDKAMTEYKLSVSIDPESAITHNNMGNVYFKKGALDEAIMEYKLATKYAPKGLIYHENLGNTYIKKGLIEEAIAEFESIVEISPKNTSTYVTLITLYWNNKRDSQKAIHYLKELSVLEPEQSESINKMIEKLGVKE
ncbi:MAG: tetratricopeptide repeat protein [Planctomycetes bacterium]|nr:tetratricopeptide repeat protein [Planctomycetota bacterium]